MSGIGNFISRLAILSTIIVRIFMSIIMFSLFTIIFPTIKVTFITSKFHFIHHLCNLFVTLTRSNNFTKLCIFITNLFKEKPQFICFCFGKILIFLLTIQFIDLICRIT